MGDRRRANHDLTVALCVSLTAHGLGLSAVAWWFVRHAPRPWHDAYSQVELARVMLPPVPIPPPRPKRPPPTPFDSHTMPKDDTGEADGHGVANRSTPGDRPMQANQGPDQADLRRANPDDPSLIDPTADQVARAGRPVPDDALPLSPASPQHGAYHPDFVAPEDVRPDSAGSVAPRAARASAEGPLPPSPPLALPTEDDPAAAPPTPSGTPTASAVSSSSVAPPPPSRAVRGRLASASDTESAPFASDATVTFQAGQVQARQGLTVQMYEPAWSLSSRGDLASMGGLHAVFGVRVRPDRTVAEVQVLVSSGRDNVDLDCERSLAYDTFDVRKDKAGHPVATVWTVVFN